MAHEPPSPPLSHNLFPVRCAHWSAAPAHPAASPQVGVLLRNSAQVMELHYAAAAVHAVVVNLNVSLAPPELLHILRSSQAQVLAASTDFAPALRAVLQLAEESGQLADLALERILWIQPPGAPARSDGTEAAAPPALPGVTSRWYERACMCAPGGPGEAAALRVSERDVAAHRALRCSGPGSLEDGYQLYYTSGTTGQPKPVMLSHRIVVLHALGTVQGAACCCAAASAYAVMLCAVAVGRLAGAVPRSCSVPLLCVTACSVSLPALCHCLCHCLLCATACVVAVTCPLLAGASSKHPTPHDTRARGSSTMIVLPAAVYGRGPSLIFWHT